jgi:hypothetical protein
MTDIREPTPGEKARIAAHEWEEKNSAELGEDYFISDLAYKKGYMQGHAAGVADGARAFGEWCDQFEAQDCPYEAMEQLAAFLADKAQR